MVEWFILANNVVDREDLSIYEKMCCVVLARYSEDDVSIEKLALKMGVEDIVAKGAFYSLMSKGILELADKSNAIKPGTIIKADKEDEEENKDEEKEIIEESFYEVKPEDMFLSTEDKILKICEIVDEKISKREAMIILSFSGNDLKRVVEKYKIAKESTYIDKVEVLLNELQKKDEKKSNVIKSVDVAEKVNVLNEVKFDDEVEENIRPKTQINTYKINMMKKYQSKK